MRDFFSEIFNKLPLARAGGESFLVLDIGTSSVKALYAERKNMGLKVAGYAHASYSSYMFTNKGLDTDVISRTSKKVLSDLKSSAGLSLPREIVLGIGGGFICGRTFTQNYIRDNARVEIGSGELTNIIQKVQQRIYEQIRSDFSRDTARSELEMRLINASLQEIKIDGYQVVNPIGFKGKEVTVALFNAYAPKFLVSVLEKLSDYLSMEFREVLSEPQAIFSSIYAGNPSGSDIILIDVGGSVTEVALARRGKLEGIKSIAIGGSSFTKSISEALLVSFGEAEKIKRKFADEGLSSHASGKLEKILSRDANFFLEALRVVLGDLSRVTLLPSQIYIYGGGASMPILKKIFRQKNWREKLSFASPPKVNCFYPGDLWNDDFSVSFPKELNSVLWTAPVVLSGFYARDLQKEDDTAKIIRRSLRLVQN